MFGKKNIILNIHLQQRVLIVNRFNLFLMCAAAVIAVLLGMNIVIVAKGGGVRKQVQSREHGVIPELKVIKKSLKFYERILSRERLFISSTGNSLVKTRPDLALVADPGIQLSDLQLMGIVSGAQGPQAIIANMKSDQSYYCYGGEGIGSFTVKEVLPAKVILEKDGETVELRL